MAEYIRRQTVLNLIDDIEYDSDWATWENPWGGGKIALKADTLDRLYNAVKSIPAADVVDEVHAENLANAHPSEEFKCSKCGTYLVDYIELRKVDGVDDFYIYEFTDWNFCPKCGARMAEGEIG